MQGEIIHIDLGVAFEQGRILPTPETIPFRLTRDMVDGFGPAGVEGVFRQCCEASLRVLRDNSLAVLTVLEVVLILDIIAHLVINNLHLLRCSFTTRSTTGPWARARRPLGRRPACGSSCRRRMTAGIRWQTGSNHLTLFV